MDNIPFLLVVSSLLSVQVFSQNCNDVINSITNIYTIPETDPAGTLIFSVSKSPSDNIAYNIAKPTDPALQSYFRHFENDTLYSFSLNRTLDLEELYSILGDDQTIAFDFTCGTIPIRTIIYVIPENEFTPSINITGDLNIPENTTVGTVVYRLRERASDKDRPASTFSFELTSNGNGTFALVNAITGYIKLESALDFESGHNFYIINISVKDTGDIKTRTSTATLRIYVTDVDDQGPRFDYPGCAAPCLIPEYTAITTLSFTGPLTVQPASIKAHDLDTLNFSITYSFYNEISGASSSDDSSGVFRIDQHTGTVYQLKLASEAIWPTQRLLIIAAEVGSSQPPAHAVIIVRVCHNDSSLDKSELPGDPKLDGQSLMYAVIAVSVVLGITIITSAIIIFTLCHRYRKLAFQDYSQPMERIQEHPYLSIDPSRIKA